MNDESRTDGRLAAAFLQNIAVSLEKLGRVDEAVWNRAEPFSAFVQQEPDEGAPATERTEIRFLLDGRQPLLEVQSALNQLDALGGVFLFIDLLLCLRDPLFERCSIHLRSALLSPLERSEICTDCPSLLAPFCEGFLVIGRHPLARHTSASLASHPSGCDDVSGM